MIKKHEYQWGRNFDIFVQDTKIWLILTVYVNP